MRNSGLHDTKVMAAIRGLPPLKQVISSNRLTANRRLGQNFINDLNLTQRIVAAAKPDLGGTIIEIGAGAGGLTRAILLAGAKQVIAIEKDPRAITALAPLVEASHGRLTLIAEDASTLAIHTLGQAPRHIIANLPYNMATHLLMQWLDEAEAFSAMTLMFQKEVASRITAKTGDSNYGRLSVMCQWLAETKLLFDVDAQAFIPKPKVTSSVVHFAIRHKPAYPANPEALAHITRLGFGQRRKMLRVSLKSIGGEALLKQADIAGTRRAQELSVAEFCRLANALTNNAT